MENIKIEATTRSPKIDFDFGANKFLIKGESYPEDVATFYGPVIGQLEEHLSSIDTAEVSFDIELIYFNSSFQGLEYDCCWIIWNFSSGNSKKI